MKKVIDITFILLIITSLCSCKKELAKQGEAAPVPVEVQVMDTIGETSSQNYVGTVEAASSSSLSFALPGTVSRVYVREGQRVSEGDVLAEIDDATFQESLAAATATLRQAQDGYNRMKQLYEKGSITEVQWVEMQTKLEQAKASEAISRKNLEKCKLRAPFSGVVGKCNIDFGMNVAPGVSTITLLKINQLQVNIPIPENVISDIKVGRPAIITVAALKNRTYRGKIDSKGVVANPMSHNYEVYVPVANPDGQLMPGMVCSVQLPCSDTTRLITLPNRVVKTDTHGNRFVWVMRNGEACPQPVVTGGLSQKGIIIEAGLQSGDSVIVKGEQKISTGSKVSVK